MSDGKRIDDYFTENYDTFCKQAMMFIFFLNEAILHGVEHTSDFGYKISCEQTSVCINRICKRLVHPSLIKNAWNHFPNANQNLFYTERPNPIATFYFRMNTIADVHWIRASLNWSSSNLCKMFLFRIRAVVI